MTTFGPQCSCSARIKESLHLKDWLAAIWRKLGGDEGRWQASNSQQRQENDTVRIREGRSDLSLKLVGREVQYACCDLKDMWTEELGPL